jgi:hypothetical protein
MAKYSKVLASEFNAVRNAVANVLGIGSGPKGYGSPVASYAVSVGEKIKAVDFISLKTDMDICYKHIVNTDATGTNPVSKGGVVTWAKFLEFQVAANFINTNSDVNGGAKQLAGPETITLASGWGNLSGKRVAVMDGTFTFPSEDAVRNYFNQGNIITVAGSGVGGQGDPKSDAFRSMAASINFTYSQTEFRANANKVVTANSPTDPYSTDFVSVTIFTQSTNTLPFRIICYDKGADNVSPSNVLAGLSFGFSRLYSKTSGITIINPSVDYSNWTYAE